MTRNDGLADPGIVTTLGVGTHPGLNDEARPNRRRVRRLGRDGRRRSVPQEEGSTGETMDELLGEPRGTAGAGRSTTGCTPTGAGREAGRAPGDGAIRAIAPGARVRHPIDQLGALTTPKPDYLSGSDPIAGWRRSPPCAPGWRDETRAPSPANPVPSRASRGEVGRAPPGRARADSCRQPGRPSVPSGRPQRWSGSWGRGTGMAAPPGRGSATPLRVGVIGAGLHRHGDTRRPTGASFGHVVNKVVD